MSDAALILKSISKTFNTGTINEKVALNNVSLTLYKGDFATIIGSNGAGKSTLLNAIAGVWPIDKGQILLSNKDVTGLPDYKRAAYVGRVFQDPMTGTAADMQIIENLALSARRGKHRTLKWQYRKNEKDEYVKMLSQFHLGLENRLTSKVGLLSGGQRQALTLLMASMTKPEILLLDEHTAALDPSTASTVLSLTNQIIEKDNLTALMVTHNMKDAINNGNRLIMMHEGRIIYDVRGEEKKNLTVDALLAKFAEVSGTTFASDEALLTK